MTSADRQIKCMLDTGADMPVWCGSEGVLKIVFPKVELVDKKFLLSGLEESLKNLFMASSFGRNFGCDLILSATMFKHMDYSILNQKKNSSVLEITYDRDEYYTQLIPNQRRSDFIEKIFSFSSENLEDVDEG